MGTDRLLGNLSDMLAADHPPRFAYPPGLALTIEQKTRPYPIALVSPEHFRLRPAGTADAGAVVQDPAISLYCLDHARRRALFTVTPSGVPLTSATFLYQAQYELATSLIAVGYDTLHDLAATVELDPRQVMFLHSVGRCGSTLVSRVLDATGDTVGLSEPDVFTQIVALLAAGACERDEAAALLRTCTRIICAPHLRSPASAPVKSVAIKFRSFASGVADLLHATLPGARTAFLYREAHAWANSTMRAFGPPPNQAPDEAAAVQDRIGRLLPLLNAYRARLGRTLTPVEAMACHWTAIMNDAMALAGSGVDLFSLRYEDLIAHPEPAVAALLRHAGLEPADRVTIDDVFGADSQAGTDLARDALDARQTDGRDLSFDHAELDRVIADLSPGLTADAVIPGTWRPPV